MNANADGLSCLPETLDVDLVKVICYLDQTHPLCETLPEQSLQQLQRYDHHVFRVDLHYGSTMLRKERSEDIVLKQPIQKIPVDKFKG
jgi:hypothetical protein